MLKMRTPIFSDGFSAVIGGAGEPFPFDGNVGELNISSSGANHLVSRSLIDLDGYGEFRISVNVWAVTGTGTATLELEYSDDGGSSWNSTGVDVDLYSGVALTASGWFDVFAEFEDDTQFRLSLTGAAGTTVQLSAVYIEAK